MADFNKCIKIILKNEGGYVWNPDDTGGETNYGISKKQYPNLDIKNLTKNEATEIYRKDYWDKIQGDKINDRKLALNIFDCSVNCGIRRTVKMIQGVCFVCEDGKLGPQTLKAINSKNSYVTRLEFERRRIKFYMAIARRKSQRQFLYSWIKRTLEV